MAGLKEIMPSQVGQMRAEGGGSDKAEEGYKEAVDGKERAGEHSLTSVTAAEWAKFREEDLEKILAEIGPTVPNQLAHLPNTTSPQMVVAHLHRDGAVIIERVISEEVCDAVVRDMEPYVEETPLGEDTFAGKTTKRTGCVPARSEASWEIVMHPLMMDTCAGVLGHQLLHKPQEGRFAPGYKAHPWQLMLTQIIQIAPSDQTGRPGGEPPQNLHRDRWAFVGDMAWEKAGICRS